LKDWLIDAGFEDVTQLTYFLLYSPWPKDHYLKELGRYQQIMSQQAIEAYVLRLWAGVWMFRRFFRRSVESRLVIGMCMLM
jgi:hypothetical protein